MRKPEELTQSFKVDHDGDVAVVTFDIPGEPVNTLLPGAGGTQRLPRLIGAQAALDLILAGKQVKPQKALKLGIVDEVVPPSILRDVAVRRARELAQGKLKLKRKQVGLRAIAGQKK